MKNSVRFILAILFLSALAAPSSFAKWNYITEGDIERVDELFGKLDLIEIFPVERTWDQYVEYRMIRYLITLYSQDNKRSQNPDDPYSLSGKQNPLPTLSLEIADLLERYESEKVRPENPSDEQPEETSSKRRKYLENNPPALNFLSEEKPSNFETLPDELMIHWMSYLDSKDFPNVRLVSGRFNALAERAEKDRAKGIWKTDPVLEVDTDPHARTFLTELNLLRDRHLTRFNVFSRAKAELTNYIEKYRAEEIYFSYEPHQNLFLLMWMDAKTELQKIAVIRNIHRAKTRRSTVYLRAHRRGFGSLDVLAEKSLTIYRQAFVNRFNLGFEPKFEYHIPVGPIIHRGMLYFE